MPATSEKQRRLMAMALHSPSKVSAKNRGVLKMSKSQLSDFVVTKKTAHRSNSPITPVSRRVVPFNKINK